LQVTIPVQAGSFTDAPENCYIDIWWPCFLYVSVKTWQWIHSTRHHKSFSL